MKSEASVKWQDGMAFDAHLGGYSFVIDADEKFGGKGLGPRPKGLTLVSLAGCTAMDVISILGKMRVVPHIESFEVATDAVIGKEHPKKIEEILVKYIFKGEKLPDYIDKIKHAIELSMENYCGVSATLKPVVKITRQLSINGNIIE
jgi:putative redox protein